MKFNVKCYIIVSSEVTRKFKLKSKKITRKGERTRARYSSNGRYAGMSMAFCGKCGARSPNEARFCPSCGAALASGGSAARQQNAQHQNQYQNQYQHQNQHHNHSQHEQFRQRQQQSRRHYQSSAGSFHPQDVAENKALAILAYFGILVLVPIFAAANSPYARFHANQGLILLILEIAAVFILGILTALFMFIFWLFGIVFSIIWVIVLLSFIAFIVIGIMNALSGEARELPIIGGFTLIP